MKIPVLHLKLGTWGFVLVALCVTCGCGTSYSWRSSVPEEMRTVSVPTFRNESAVSELGAVATRQILREFQREGTFRIRRAGDAALEVQGVVKSASFSTLAYDRKIYGRLAASEFRAEAEVSVPHFVRRQRPDAAGRRQLPDAETGQSRRLAAGRYAGRN